MADSGIVGLKDTVIRVVGSRFAEVGKTGIAVQGAALLAVVLVESLSLGEQARRMREALASPGAMGPISAWRLRRAA